MVEKDICTGCGACAAACSQKAITMQSDQEGFFYPTVQPALCNQCGRCDTVCHLNQGKGTGGEKACFGARAKEDEMRMLGSSGGIFPLLARHILQKGGVVFGAMLQEDGSVQHRKIERAEEIGQLSRTKYVQSGLTKVWEEIRELLHAGRQVLFCATPCQSAALLAFLGGKRENLMVADLICYGVPSPGIWQRYIHFLEKRYGGKFCSFSFRDKRRRDSGRTCALQIEGKEYTHSLSRDLFCRTFFRNINIRPSCFHCRYATVERDSDITLGDFWGIDQIRPGMDDGMGISAVICHTPRGRRLWEQIQAQAEWFPCRIEEIANDMQPRLREPVRPSPRRGIYMRLYRWLPFSLWIRLFIR